MMVQTKAPIPGSAILPIVHETAGLIAQGMEGRQLIVRNGGWATVSRAFPATEAI